MIAGSEPGKTANDESLARDEGGSRNPQTEQGRQLRMTPATATIFSRLWMQLCSEPPSSKGDTGMSTTSKLQEEPQDSMCYNQQT